MGVDIRQLVPWFDGLATAAHAAMGIVPDTGKPVLAAVEVALHFASDLARQGISPAEHLTRLHAADTDLQSVESRWAEELRKKFTTPG